MHKRLGLLAVLSLALFVQAALGLRGSETPPSEADRSAETTVDIEEYLYSQLSEHNKLGDSIRPFSIYVQKLQGRTLMKPVLKHKDAHGKIDFVARARTAELTVLAAKRQLRIRLQQGVVIGEDDSRASFESKDFAIDLPKDFDPK